MSQGTYHLVKKKIPYVLSSLLLCKTALGGLRKHSAGVSSMLMALKKIFNVDDEAA